MKTKHHLTLCALSVALSVFGRAQDIKFTVPTSAPAAQPAPATPTPETPAASPAAAPAPSYTDAQECEEIGWIFAKKTSTTTFDFTPEERAAIVKGFAEAFGGGDAPYPLQQIGPGMSAFMQGKEKIYLTTLKAQNVAANEEFLTKLKADKDVVELPSGLHYKIEKAGDGPYPTASDTVTMQYVGKLINGNVFDNSYRRNKPFEFAVGQGGLIPGMVEGIQKINKGGRITLFIPPQLAYGDEGAPGVIPPSALLVFDIEVLDIKPTPPAAPK
jgi:FKBP-type peptidyl-prolyl cis-trans isomerase